MDSKILPTNSIRLFYLSIFILLFGGANVLHFIGWNIDYYAAPTYQKLRPEFYILFIVFISRLKNIKFSLTEISILIFTFFVFLYWLVTGQTNGFAVLINTICIPAIISLLLKYTNHKQRRELCIQYARVRIVLPMIEMEIVSYFKEVILPIFKVLILSSILPLVFYLSMEQSLSSFFIVCIVSLFSVILVSYIVGCTDMEQTFLRNKMLNVIKRITNIQL